MAKNLKSNSRAKYNPLTCGTANTDGETGEMDILCKSRLRTFITFQFLFFPTVKTCHHWNSLLLTGTQAATDALLPEQNKNRTTTKKKTTNFSSIPLSDLWRVIDVVFECITLHANSYITTLSSNRTVLTTEWTVTENQTWWRSECVKSMDRIHSLRFLILFKVRVRVMSCWNIRRWTNYCWAVGSGMDPKVLLLPGERWPFVCFSFVDCQESRAVFFKVWVVTYPWDRNIPLSIYIYT